MPQSMIRRPTVLACIGMLSAFCAAREPAGNIAPLAFGMTAPEASAALEAPLVRVAGRAGSEIFVAGRAAPVQGFAQVRERYSLQFRHGRLTGWKRQWSQNGLAFF